MIGALKNDYGTEPVRLLRQQYKSSNKLISFLTAYASQFQEIENEIYKIYDLNRNYGVNDNDGLIDPAVKIGQHFGVFFIEPFNLNDVIERSLARIWVAVSHGNPKELTGLSEFVYGYKSNYHDSKGAVTLTVQGEISEDNGRKGKVLYSSAINMMPPTIELSFISEAPPTNGFSFLEFGPATGFSEMDDFSNTFSRTIIDKNGDFIARS